MYINSNYDGGRHKIPGCLFLAGLGTWEYVESRNADDSTAQDGHGMASSIMQLSMEDWKWKMGSTCRHGPDTGTTIFMHTIMAMCAGSLSLATTAVHPVV